LRPQRSILIIVQNLPVPFDRRVWQEATSLRRAGFGVAVICPKKGIDTKSYELLEGVDIYRYPLLYEADQGFIGYFVEFLYCWLASLCLAIKAYLHRPFQAIHACNPPDTYFLLAMLFRILGVRFVFDHHDLCPEMYLAKGRAPGTLLYRAQLWLERRTLRFADVVIAVNQSHRDIAIERGGIDPSKIVIVRSGPPRGWADFQSADPQLKEGHKYLVVYLGEMCEQDGLEGLVQIIQRYKQSGADDTLFVLIGGGPQQKEISNLVERLQLNSSVKLTGRVSDRALQQYLATADVCVDPDPFSEWANLSTMNKMIEYLAFGKPIVAFDLLEHRRTVQDAAMYVSANDTDQFAEVLRDLLIDEPRRLSLSRLGRQRFAEFLAWDNSVPVLIQLYSDLLEVPAHNTSKVAPEAFN
jgi:glycosyltransferase involved in cell wall biosynthesis